MAKLPPLDASWGPILRSLFNWRRNFRVTGPGVQFKNTEDGCSIYIPGGNDAGPREQNRWIWIKVTGNTQDSTNKRWKYDWVEVEKSSTGYGGWTTISGGRSGHGTDYDYAYNAVENMNGSSGAYGNGVSSSNLTGTLDIKPIPTNVVILGRLVTPQSATKPEVWVWYANGIDGGCT